MAISGLWRHHRRQNHMLTPNIVRGPLEVPSPEAVFDVMAGLGRRRIIVVDLDQPCSPMV